MDVNIIRDSAMTDYCAVSGVPAAPSTGGPLAGALVYPAGMGQTEDGSHSLSLSVWKPLIEEETSKVRIS